MSDTGDDDERERAMMMSDVLAMIRSAMSDIMLMPAMSERR